ncbi:MAG: hypothetical protein LBQ24_07425 [Candidatus Peribacteria bacterium]|jgi:hypothetical protein|nr:hypothetical protein [Candidatus Peribacteria bacterium]
MLAKNYVSIPKEQASENEKENKNKENDLKTTLEVVTNKIIEENSADFKKRN